MRISCYLTAIAFFLINQLNAQVSIGGTCKAYAGEPIQLLQFNDAYHQIPEVLETVELGEDGSFQFSRNFKVARRVALQIGSYRAQLYVSPNSKYQLEMDAFDPSSAPPLSREKYLSFKLLEQDADSINLRIIDVNVALENFQQQYYMAYMHNRLKENLPVLKEYLDGVSSKSQFIQDYQRSLYARQALMAGVEQREIFETYLNGPIEYHNPAYMDLYDEFYKNWFQRYVAQDDGKWLQSAIMNENADSLKLLLNRNDYMKNEEVQEQVILREFYREGINSQGEMRQRYAHIIENIGASTSNENNKLVAQHYLNSMRKLVPGEAFPSIQAKTLDGNPFDNEELKGKFVYLNFWTQECQSCLKSMSLLNSIQEQFKDSLVVVSICLNDDFEDFKTLVSEANYKWKHVFANNSVETQDTFNAWALPLYYLIDPNGNLLEAPAILPEEGIALQLKSLIKPEQGKKSTIWDWNKRMPGDK